VSVLHSDDIADALKSCQVAIHTNLVDLKICVVVMYTHAQLILHVCILLIQTKFQMILHMPLPVANLPFIHNFMNSKMIIVALFALSLYYQVEVSYPAWSSG
jgi:hypothetical protein